MSLAAPVWYVTLAPDDRRNLGEARFTPDWARQIDERQLAILTLAGPCAERRFTGGRDILHGSAHDMDVVRLCLELKSDDAAVQQQYFDRYLAQATAKVLLHWSWIEAVARELLREGEVMGSRIRALRPK
jgi:hypothetical protein